MSDIDIRIIDLGVFQMARFSRAPAALAPRNLPVIMGRAYQRRQYPNAWRIGLYYRRRGLVDNAGPDDLADMALAGELAPQLRQAS